MSTTLDIRELPKRLEEALALAAAGTEVVLLDGLTPRARLVACDAAKPRVAGLHAGAIQPAEDFDAPLPEELLVG